MSWPWRPNTWEKGLRLQVSVSSMAELLREGKGPASSERGSASERGEGSAVEAPEQPSHSHSLTDSLIICTSRPLLRLSQGCHLLLTAVSPLTADQSRVSSPQMPSELLLLLSWWGICVGVALSLLISAPVWRCFRQRAQANTAWTKQERERERERE